MAANHRDAPKESGGAPRDGGMKRAGGRFWAMLRQRCPRCRTGRIFRGMISMNDPCPHCGLLFDREPGYFLGAMYISYGISVALLLPVFVAAIALLPDWNGYLVLLLVVAAYLPLVPAIFRYSRVLWVHFDRASTTYTELLTPFEKKRLQQLNADSEDKQQGRDPGAESKAEAGPASLREP